MTLCWGSNSDSRRAFVAMVALRCVALEREAWARILRRFAAFAAVEPLPPGRAGFHDIKLLSRSMCRALRFAGGCEVPSLEEESDIAPPDRLKWNRNALRQRDSGVFVSALSVPVEHDKPARGRKILQ